MCRVRYACSITLLLALTLAPKGQPSSLNRIIGGVPVSPGEFPYQVSIQLQDPFTQAHIPICGGAIVSRTTILGAAHCSLIAPHGSYRVLAGEHDLTLPEGKEQIRFVKEIITHGGFNEFTFNNDVALYILEDPLEFNGAVGSVALPPQGSVPSGPALVAGWGVTTLNSKQEGAAGSNVLNKIQIPIYPDAMCKEIYGEDFMEGEMICAGSLDGGKDTCAGDSGGALVTEEGEEKVKVAVGIVSWGTGCGVPGLLGVYTNVSYYVDWINYVMELVGGKEAGASAYS